MSKSRRCFSSACSTWPDLNSQCSQSVVNIDDRHLLLTLNWYFLMTELEKSSKIKKKVCRQSVWSENISLVSGVSACRQNWRHDDRLWTLHGKSNGLRATLTTASVVVSSLKFVSPCVIFESKWDVSGFVRIAQNVYGRSISHMRMLALVALDDMDGISKAKKKKKNCLFPVSRLTLLKKGRP